MKVCPIPMGWTDGGLGVENGIAIEDGKDGRAIGSIKYLQKLYKSTGQNSPHALCWIEVPNLGRKAYWLDGMFHRCGSPPYDLI